MPSVPPSYCTAWRVSGDHQHRYGEVSPGPLRTARSLDIMAPIFFFSAKFVLQFGEVRYYQHYYHHRAHPALLLLHGRNPSCQPFPPVYP